MDKINLTEFEKELRDKYGIESLETYEKILKDCYDKELKLNDMEYQDIIDKYGIKMHYDSLRKSQQTPFGTVAATQYLLMKNDNKSPMEQVREVLGEQYIVKRQIHNDRLKLNKIKRDLVPSITVAEELKQYMIENNFSITVPEYMYEPIIDNSEYTMICHITDWHIGYVINNCNGNYFNWEIANERVNKYISECKKYIHMYGIKKVYLISTGDMIEHCYMRNDQEHSCEFLQSMQIAKVEKLLYRLIVALAKDCQVIYGGIAGNHDRMSGDKKKNYEGDNANVLITENLKDMIDITESVRVSFIDTRYTDSEINIEINGLSCKFIHGDKYKNDKNNFAKIISSDNQFFDLIFSGHLHNFSVNSENHGRYIISTGCLSGFNDYSKNMQCSTDASQTIVILGDSKVEMIKDIRLSD